MSYYVVATLIETQIDLRGLALSSTGGFGVRDESLNGQPTRAESARVKEFRVVMDEFLLRRLNHSNLTTVKLHRGHFKSEMDHQSSSA